MKPKNVAFLQVSNKNKIFVDDKATLRGQYTVHVTLLCTKSFGKTHIRKMRVQTEFCGVFLFKTNKTIPSPSMPNYSHIRVHKYHGFFRNILFSSLVVPTLLRGGMYWVVHSQQPRDVPRAKPKGHQGHLEGWGKFCTLYNPIHPDSRQCKAILWTLIHP